MPPQFALLLCTIFVLFLLRVERKQAPKVSRALWIPTIWTLYIASKPLALWFQSGAEDIESGSPLDQMFLSALLCLGLVILVRRRFDWFRAMKEHAWLVLLIGYMLASILWSDILFISFKRWIREVIAVVMAFLILTERDPRQAVQSIFRRTVYILVPFSFILIKYYPQYGVEYGRWSGEQMWIGVTMQKNGLGRLCVISAFFLTWTLVTRRQARGTPTVKYQTYADMVVLVITLLLLKGPSVAAMSATAVTTFAAGIATFVILLLMKKCKMYIRTHMLMAIIMGLIIFGNLSVFAGGSTLGFFTSTVERDETLTGRTDIWAVLLPVAMGRPMLGHGFGGFWTSTSRIAYEISEGHSGYLDVLLDLGFVGLVLISIFLLSSCQKAQRVLAYDYDWGILWICYLLMVVIHNITESSLSSFTSHLMAVLLFLTASSTGTNSYTQEVSREVGNVAAKDFV